jgi:phospholipid transport system substrate-binding protein
VFSAFDREEVAGAGRMLKLGTDMKSRRWIAALVLFLAVTTAAFANPAAQTWVKDQRTQLMTALKKGGPAKTNKKVEAIVDQMLDYDTLAQDSLGKEWAKHTAEEQKKFTELLTALVRRSYRNSLDKTLIDYDVTYTEVETSKKGVKVYTVAKNRKNRREEPTQIDYLVHEVNGTWRIRDVTTEGSSMVRNYRRQFRKIIKKHDFDELLKRMQKKLDKPPESKTETKTEAKSGAKSAIK